MSHLTELKMKESHFFCHLDLPKWGFLNLSQSTSHVRAFLGKSTISWCCSNNNIKCIWKKVKRVSLVVSLWPSWCPWDLAAILCVSACICWTLGPPFSRADQFPSPRLNFPTGSQRDLDLQLSLIAVEVKMPKLALKPGLSWEQSCSFVFPHAESWSHEFKMCTRN